MRTIVRIAMALWVALALDPAGFVMQRLGGQSADSAERSALSWLKPALAEAAPPEGLSEPPPDSSDTALTHSLTNYFKQHRLPLVGAQVVTNKDGSHRVTLYGFVATPFGKSDAEQKARHFLGGSSLDLTNRIKVRPELKSTNRSSANSSASTGKSPPARSEANGSSGDLEANASVGNLKDYSEQDQIRAYQQQNQIQQYQQQGQDPLLSVLVPLLGLAAMAAIISHSGSVGVAPGGGYYPSYPPPYYGPPASPGYYGYPYTR